MNLSKRMFGRLNWFAVMPIVIGLPFLYIGLSEVYKAYKMIKVFDSGQGIVVENIWRAFA